MQELSKTRAMISDQEGLSFDDVLLVPKLGVLEKREKADISGELVSGFSLPIPIVSAPMQSVTEQSMAIAIYLAGGFGIIHRFMSIEEQARQIKPLITSIEGVGAALGVNEGYDRFLALYEVGCRIFCLDIAHAHHLSVADFLAQLPRPKDDPVYLIVGNVATGQGATFLATLGADAVKVGIGPGAACSTRERTGFGVPQLSAIMDVKDKLTLTNPDIRIIADGGIRNSGDIVKALAAGADTVMLGRLLAGADESPYPGEYWGMASERVNGHRAPEGIEGKVPLTGPVEDTLKELAWGIRSGISYAGGVNVDDLRRNAEFIKVTPMSIAESGTRL